MSKCVNPDERLFKLDEHQGIEQRVAEIEEYWRTKKRFPFGICGAMWYGTPVTRDEAHHKIKWRYGVELEFEFYRLSTDGTTEYGDYPRLAAIIANHHLGLATRWGHGGITEDHSLDRGFEVILPAMSTTKVLEMLTPIFEDRHIKPYLRQGFNAAMHVTVDPFETKEQQVAFHDFWDHPKFFTHFMSVTGRDEVPYCRRRKRKSWGEDGFMKPDTLERHYHRCNVRHNGAMEVRVFAAQYDGGMPSQLRLVDMVNRQVRRGIYDYETIRKYVYGKYGMNYKE